MMRYKEHVSIAPARNERAINVVNIVKGIENELGQVQGHENRKPCRSQ